MYFTHFSQINQKKRKKEKLSAKSGTENSSIKAREFIIASLHYCVNTIIHWIAY